MTEPLNTYQESALTAAEAEALPGLVVLDFGANWCQFCQASAPLLEAALAAQPSIAHIGVADGKGQRLGRHYRVKLWPTMVFLKNGQEVARLVRPDSPQAVQEAVAQLNAGT